MWYIRGGRFADGRLCGRSTAVSSCGVKAHSGGPRSLDSDAEEGVAESASEGGDVIGNARATVERDRARQQDRVC